MNKLIWTKKQKQKLLNELKSDIYTTLKVVESWVESCESRDQLQSIIDFLDRKVSQYDYILSSYNIAFWYTNSIYDDVKEYLFSHIKQIEGIHSEVLEEINYLEQEMNAKKPIVIRGFREED